MSRISVWTPKGTWSAPVCGLDKVHLVKEAIEISSEAEIKKAIEKSEYWENIPIPLDDYEIDSKSIVNRVQILKEEYDNGEEIISTIQVICLKTGGEVVNAADSRIFMMPLAVLKELEKKDTLYTETYKYLIAQLEASSVSCVMLKFEDE